MTKIFVVIFLLIIILNLSAYQADVKFTDSWDKQGLSIEEQNTANYTEIIFKHQLSIKKGYI